MEKLFEKIKINDIKLENRLFGLPLGKVDQLQ
jgi:2,4-dienoyl-CoA reductase-like NADH-dependent reductase (Old Yellow Enzyme family)